MANEREFPLLPRRGFGRGYPFLIASHLLNTRAGDDLKIYNRGISGHKGPDLDARRQTDTIDLKPDLIGILIGVNDIWHKLGGRYDGTVETYEKGSAALPARTRKALPNVRIVCCDPFVLRDGVHPTMAGHDLMAKTWLETLKL